MKKTLFNECLADGQNIFACKYTRKNEPKSDAQEVSFLSCDNIPLETVQDIFVSHAVDVVNAAFSNGQEFSSDDIRPLLKKQPAVNNWLGAPLYNRLKNIGARCVGTKISSVGSRKGRLIRVWALQK